MRNNNSISTFAFPLPKRHSFYNGFSKTTFYTPNKSRSFSFFSPSNSKTKTKRKKLNISSYNFYQHKYNNIDVIQGEKIAIFQNKYINKFSNFWGFQKRMLNRETNIFKSDMRKLHKFSQSRNQIKHWIENGAMKENNNHSRKEEFGEITSIYKKLREKMLIDNEDDP